MSGFLDPNADGLALLLWVLGGLCVALALAFVVEPIVTRRQRHQRGQWGHLTSVSSMRDRAREARAK